MSYRRPGNPAVISNAKFSAFDGVGGPSIQVLKRFNERGWDISNTVANDITDLSILQHGSLILRDGSRKINTTGQSDTVTNVFYISLGNVLAYGAVVDGALTVATLPTVNVDLNPVELSNPNTRTVASIYTAVDPSIVYP